jgi:hypothetical protein
MMLKRSLLRSCMLTGLALAIVAGFFVAPCALSAQGPARQPAMFVDWKDTGKIVNLAVGQQMVVKLPIRGYHDDAWQVTQISPALKLIGGPDELRPVNWSPWKFSFQVFYFQRQAPGTVNFVMEPNYYQRPLVLKVVDR